MTAAALTWAVVAAGVFIGSGAVVSLAVKKAFFPAWRGSVGVTVAVLIGTCWALALGQLLGAVGWLRTAPLLGAAVASAVAATLVSRRSQVAAPAEAPRADDPAPTPPAQAALLVATVLLVFLVAAVWTARTVIAARRGIADPDSLGYHLPFAATFAQTGFADQNRFVLPSLPIQFYPANDELLAGLALVLTKSMAFAAVKNLLFGGLVLVAAHAVGKTFDAGLAAVSGAAIVLGLPVIAFSQPGEAVNDAFVMFVLLGGVAVLARAGDRPAPYVLALACAGAAYGTKFSSIVPGVALGGLALWLLRARVPTRRLRAAGAGMLASLAVGGSWYLRNAVSYGNPLPPADIGLGPFQLRQIETDALGNSFSVAWYLVRGRALGQFWDGLDQAMGPLFLPVLVALGFGVVAGFGSGDRFRRGLAVLAVLTMVGYLTTPASAYGGKGNPVGFVINVHYAASALVLGLVAAAIALGRRRWAVALPVVGLPAVAGGIPAGQRIPVWAPEIGGRAFTLLVAAGLAGGAVAWMSTRPSLVRWVRPGAGAAAVLAVIGVAVIARQYPRDLETDAVVAWAAREQPTRIAGWVPEVALLYGPGVPNRAVTLTRLEDGAPVPLDSCPAWMQALREGAYPFTGVIPGTKWQRWMDADPAFQLVAKREGRAAVYRVAGVPNPRCPGAR